MKRSMILPGIAATTALLVLLGIRSVNFALDSRPADQNLQGTEVIISDGSGPSAMPVVAYNSHLDEYLVVWKSQLVNGYDVRGQRVNGAGALVGDNFTITVLISTSSFLDFPAVAYNSGQGEFLVVWRDEELGAFRGQRVSSDGVLSGTPFTVTASLDNEAHNPALIYAPESDVFLLTWRGCVLSHQAAVATPDGGGDSCYFCAKSLNGEGVSIGESVTATNATFLQGYPALTYEPESQVFWIVWTEQYALAAQRVMTTGVLAGEPFTIVQGTTEMLDPSISAISDRGEFLVVWRNQRGASYQSQGVMGGGYSDIYAQRGLSGGTLVGDRFRVSSTGLVADEPKVVYLSDQDQYFVVWTKVDIEGDFGDVYGKWLSGTGELVGYDFPVALAPGSQHDAMAAGNGPVLAVWQDSQGGVLDIRGRILEQPWWVYLPLAVRELGQ